MKSQQDQQGLNAPKSSAAIEQKGHKPVIIPPTSTAMTLRKTIYTHDPLNFSFISYLLTAGFNPNLIVPQNANRLLHLATVWVARNEHALSIVQTLLAYGTEVDARNANGDTALQLATAMAVHYPQAFEVMKMLLILRKKIYTRNPLSVSFISYLLTAGFNPNLIVPQNANRLLHLATVWVAHNEHALSIVQMLLAHGAEVDARNANGDTALQLATAMAVHYPQAFEVMKLLLIHGANIDTRNNSGNTPLHLAATVASQNPAARAVVEWLLFYGAEVDARNANSATAFHIATEYAIDYPQAFEVMKLLLYYEADIDTTDEVDNTVLHIAAKNINGYAVARFLLEQGADPDSLNTYLKSPLHLAVESENVQIVQLLIKANCLLDVPDEYGNSALTTAIEIGCFTLIALLLQAGAAMIIIDAEAYTDDMETTHSVINEAVLALNCATIEKNQTGINFEEHEAAILQLLILAGAPTMIEAQNDNKPLKADLLDKILDHCRRETIKTARDLMYDAIRGGLGPKNWTDKALRDHLNIVYRFAMKLKETHDKRLLFAFDLLPSDKTLYSIKDNINIRSFIKGLINMPAELFEMTKKFMRQAYLFEFLVEQLKLTPEEATAVSIPLEQRPWQISFTLQQLENICSFGQGNLPEGLDANTPHPKLLKQNTLPITKNTWNPPPSFRGLPNINALYQHQPNPLDREAPHPPLLKRNTG
jgi:ankyrin repeat protein